MYQYILRRLLYALPTLLGITLLIFFVLRILPGDPLVILYGEGGVGSLSDADRAAIRHQLGFDRPLDQQYAYWLKDLLSGNLGHTLARGDSVAEIIWERGILTGEIAVLAVLVSWSGCPPASLAPCGKTVWGTTWLGSVPLSSWRSPASGSPCWW